ncbi:tyrosine-type recombinase/integrase [Crossiella sp. CA198]|uniref:tyrosine-type recombinase/integrase n=1 Tax=Crossiella sp. CA198 TaxID=3455607 RepID=UPI003F8D6DA1
MYRSYHRNHISPFVGKQMAGSVDAEVLDSLYAELLRCRVHCDGRKRTDHRTTRKHECDHRCGPHQCKPLGATAVRHIHFLLSGAYKRANRWKWVSHNPCTQAEPPPAPPPNPKPPTAENAAKILNEAWRVDPDWGTFIWLAMTTGARRGELCGLRWWHIDLDNAVIILEKAMRGRREKDTKTHQHRRIALDAETVLVLREYLARCQARAAALGIELRVDAFAFSLVPDHGVALLPSSVTQRFERLAERLDIDTTLNKLRHYSATELIAAGVDIRTVSGRLGHAGGGTTTLKNYSAFVALADQRAADSLAPRMPSRPAFEPDSVERAKTDPRSPYEKLAAELRQQILDGKLTAGTPLPGVRELGNAHSIALSTAHRAISLLKKWGLVEAQGRRTTIVREIEITETATATSATTDTDLVHEDDLYPLESVEIEVRRDGQVVRKISAAVDLGDFQQLKRLLIATIRRSGGDVTELDRYEMDIMRYGQDKVLTTFVVAG